MNIAKMLHDAAAKLGAGDAVKADAILRRVLKKNPTDIDALNLSGVAAYHCGDLARATKLLRRVLLREPDHTGTLLNLGAVSNSARQFKEAERCYRKVLETSPADPIALTNLGKNYLDQNKLERAQPVLEQAVRADPNYWIAAHNLGSCLQRRGETEAAIKQLCKANSLNENPGTTAELISSLRRTDRFGEEVCEVNRLLAMPNVGELMCAGVETLFDSFDWARIESLRPKLLELLRSPHASAESRSRALLLLNSLPKMDAETIYACHRAWATSLPASNKLMNSSKPVVPEILRIAYLSPDFREHSVGFFIEPLIAAHDKTRFSIFCYSNRVERDSTTARIEQHATEFVDVSGLSDEELVDRARSDDIDILIDLAGHTRDSRIAALRKRMAPIQITYLGYPNTTGLDTVDYRISDPHVDSDNGTRYSEHLLRLPQSFLCFDRFVEVDRIGSSPCEKTGDITFGCFNNLRKITPDVVAAWSKILNAVAKSRLVIKSRRADTSIVRSNLLAAFAGHEIDPARIELRSSCDTRAAHLASYNDIDIALDTFPYHGTTTTCESLWMDVPVVTFAGQAHAQRVSYSILKNLDLEQLVAWDESAYVNIALGLSKDFGALSALRRSIRTRLEQSVLCDSQQFARQFEQALLSVVTNEKGSGSRVDATQMQQALRVG